MLEKRLRKLNEIQPQSGPVVYWMSRDQRALDNWALVYAQSEARAEKEPLIVFFTLVDAFLEARDPHYACMAKGLLEVMETLESKKIPFIIVPGNPKDTVPRFLKEVGAGQLVSDSHVLREPRKWKEDVNRNLSCSHVEMDAHNIIPVWLASPKAEYGAYTIRPKIHRLLDEFLVSIPELESHPYSRDDADEWLRLQSIRTRQLLLDMSQSSPEASGSRAAMDRMRDFAENRLPDYSMRNDPNQSVTSELSRFIHFGQISVQRIALEVRKTGDASSDEFLEELIVRRELAENFCYYNPRYDSLEGAPDWAKKTLHEHEADPREYLYRTDDLEEARTHDRLWNAAQTEMVHTGTMPGYLRMYWAKKILEWSKNADEAYSAAIYLNNRYFWDGRDANGYAGIAWSIGGVHDRAWAERQIFGKIRYMSLSGAKRKFDVMQYIHHVEEQTGTSVHGSV